MTGVFILDGTSLSGWAVFRAKLIKLGRCTFREIETGELLHERPRLVPERPGCVVLGNVDQQPDCCLGVAGPVVSFVHRMQDVPPLEWLPGHPHCEVNCFRE